MLHPLTADAVNQKHNVALYHSISDQSFLLFSIRQKSYLSV